MSELSLSQMTSLGNFGRSLNVPAYLFQPKNTAELVEAFKVAKENGLRIAPRGAGRSYNDAAVSGGGIVLDLSLLTAEEEAHYDLAQNYARDNGDGHSWWYTLDQIKELYLSPKQYLDIYASYALTYAFIDKDGNWCQRGEMGWWGMDDPDKGTPDYNQAWWDFVNSLDPHDRVWVVDCHI